MKISKFHNVQLPFKEIFIGNKCWFQVKKYKAQYKKKLAWCGIRHLCNICFLFTESCEPRKILRTSKESELLCYSLSWGWRMWVRLGKCSCLFYTVHKDQLVCLKEISWVQHKFALFIHIEEGSWDSGGWNLLNKITKSLSDFGF